MTTLAHENPLSTIQSQQVPFVVNAGLQDQVSYYKNLHQYRAMTPRTADPSELDNWNIHAQEFLYALKKDISTLIGIMNPGTEPAASVMSNVANVPSFVNNKFYDDLKSFGLPESVVDKLVAQDFMNNVVTVGLSGDRVQNSGPQRMPSGQQHMASIKGQALFSAKLTHDTRYFRPFKPVYATLPNSFDRNTNSKHTGRTLFTICHYKYGTINHLMENNLSNLFTVLDKMVTSGKSDADFTALFKHHRDNDVKNELVASLDFVISLHDLMEDIHANATVSADSEQLKVARVINYVVQDEISRNAAKSSHMEEANNSNFGKTITSLAAIFHMHEPVGITLDTSRVHPRNRKDDRGIDFFIKQ